MWLANLYKKYETREISDILEFMSESQYWDVERIRQYQYKKIIALLKHSYHHVSYYRKIFDDLKITPRDIRSLADYRCLPVLTKDIIRNNFQNLISKNFHQNDLIANSTGGSTGEPLHLYQDKNYGLWADAARIRGWYNIAGCRNGDTTAVLWGAMNEVGEDYSLKERVIDYLKNGVIMLNAFNLSDERKNKFISYCQLMKPKLLRGYTTALRDLALYIEKEKINFPRVEGIILCAETVSRETQEYIEHVFGAPSYNTYGGRELSLIAMECSSKCGLHEISENNYVEHEIIELDGYVNVGNLIITNLNNFAMPFLRYRIGDLGVRGDTEVCQCGRGLPLIGNVIGRSTEVFEFINGVKIAGEMFIHLMKDFPLTDYQFVQKSQREVELRIMKGDRVGAEVRKEIVSLYSAYLPQGVRLYFQEVDNFQKTLTGKFQFVLKDFQDET